MQPATSDKTFHLKWNNHLQNLSQLFTAIYSSSALADVTLSCRDGAIRAHKLVLSACSPYFEQIFRDNPCKHPVIILKGIPYAEINLLVEFMYKGSVDVQEIDLQSLMHTASELEIRGLAYELRKDASSLLNVNLNEYPAFGTTQNQDATFAPTTESVTHNATFETNSSTPKGLQTNLDRLHQIHLYQQSMSRNTPYNQVQNSTSLASEAKRKRKNDDTMAPNTTTAVKNILAAAAKELAEKKELNAKPKSAASIQTEEDVNESNVETYESDSGEAEQTMENEELPHGRDTRFKGKKRVSVGLCDEYTPTPRILAKSKQNRKSIKLSIKTPNPSDGTASYDSEDGISKVIISAVSGGGVTTSQVPPSGVLKCVNLNDLRESRDNNVTVIDDDDSSAVDTSDENNLLVETVYESTPGHEEDYDSNDSKNGLKNDERVFKCDICALSFVRKFHMKRHRRTHTGERPFQCDDCPFSFNRSSHLARHRRTHTGERPYHCEACGRTFTRGDKLKLHLRICEKDEYVLPSRLNPEDPSKLHIKKEVSQAVLPGMVSIGHSERHQLMFTSSGDVLLAPRSQSDSMNDMNASTLSEINESNQSSFSLSDINSSKLNLSMLGNQPSTSESLLTNQFYSLDAAGFPIKRGRGRPRKKPLPIVVPLIKKKRGRPPKIIKLDPMDPTSAKRPLENYNVSNLPYGDFSYLTDIISTHFNPSNPQSYQNMMQINPLLDNAKLANLIATAVSQSQNAAAVTASPSTPNVESTKIQLADTKITPVIVTQNNTDASIAQASIDSVQQSAVVNNASENSSPSPPPTTEENDNLTQNIGESAITDLTSDKEESGDDDGEMAKSGDETKSEDMAAVEKNTAFDITKLDISDGPMLSTIGECTIKPVIKE